MIHRLDRYVLTCNSRRHQFRTNRINVKRRLPMRLSRMLALGAVSLALVSACSLGGGSKPTIKIGSVGFDEARVMAEVYAQVLEANGYTVDRTGIGLGARPVVAPAIESG